MCIDNTWWRRSTKGSANPPPWDVSFDVFDASVIDYLSQYVKTPKQKGITQMGALMWSDNSGDDDGYHGEEWMENPLIYNKVLGWSRK